MRNIAVHKVKTLRAEARRVVQSLLGRRLRDDEEVTVMAFPPHPAPTKAVRRMALGRMERVLEKAAGNMKGVPDSSFDTALDEAMMAVRQWK